jgi:cardiolipin synthase A/B
VYNLNYNLITILDRIFLLNSIVLIAIIILERRSPEKTIAWFLVFIVLPPLGILLYIFIGRNWKRHKLNNNFTNFAKEVVDNFINRTHQTEFKPLLELLANNSESPVFDNNEIEVFNNGKDKFDALKEELEKAEHHIHLEYFIVKSDQIGNEIKDILIKKSLEGVRVIFIIDKVGSNKLSHKYIKDLKGAGVEIVYYTYFLAPLLLKFNTQINYRNHRKIAIIDGKVGFLGGMNIGDEYLGKGRLGFWRDTHIMVKGSFVLGLQALFLNDYFYIKNTNGSNDIFIGEADKYCPTETDSGNKIMQLVHSGPNSEYPSILQCVLKMVSMAQKSILITTPYFIPTESLQDALKVAALGGVKIKILFPGRFDHYIVYQASQTYLKELIKCGVKIYFYDKNAFIHSKIITIDGEISNVGTANMDIRSYMLNYEVNTVIYDKEITARLDNDFEMNLQSSVEITEEYFDKMPIYQKSIQSLARVLSYLL